MKDKEKREFVELKVYKNKRTNQRTIILPRKKIKEVPNKVKYFLKSHKIKW